MEVSSSEVSNFEQLKKIPIQLIPIFIFKEEHKLSFHNNDYFLVGSIRDNNIIGKKIDEVDMESKSMDILSVVESEGSEWLAMKNGNKYNIYSKKRELLTSIPTKVWVKLEM